MPRTFLRRQGERVRRENRRARVLKPHWVDPTWFALGSSIEKMVMGELMRRGIYFEHNRAANTLGGYVDPSWEADILVPQHKIWIEVQGGYFHTLPGQVESDAYRFAAIEAAGWRPLFWWENDIRTRLNELCDAVPEFYMATAGRSVKREDNTGYGFYEGGTVDHLAGLRKALANRTKPKAYTRRVAKKRRAK